MKYTVGTNHFHSKHSALVYYRALGFNLEDVDKKIIGGEIAIGPPKIDPGQKLLIKEGRYWIEG